MTAILLKYDHGNEKYIAFPIEMFENALFARPEGDKTFGMLLWPVSST